MTMQFQGFKPEAMQRIAGTLGYDGDMSKFDGYLEDNPEAKEKMGMYNQQAVSMMNGGMVRKNFAEGGVPKIKEDTINRMKDPKLPAAGEIKAVGTEITDDTILNTDTKLNSYQQGMTQKEKMGNQAGRAEIADVPKKIDAVTVDTVKAAPKLESELDKKEKITATVGKDSLVTAVTDEETLVSDLKITEGDSIDVEKTAKRKEEIGERIDPTANAETASAFTEEIQAETALPSAKATVKGQLTELMADFEGGATPPWAAGAMRGVAAAMASRGLSASSMAGQAMIQAAMESALPIASADAGTFASFEAKNLTNKQERAMIAAKHRAEFIGQEFDQEFQTKVKNATMISEIANTNFNAEQTIALENSRAANTMELKNVSNKNALLMGEVAALSNLETTNLNNVNIAAVKNAKTFLETDMKNIEIGQQDAMFKTQQRVQALFNDTSADNATKQFNATSETQVDQFFSKLATSVSEFNVTQKNAMTQFNDGESNAMEKFNTEVRNKVDQFNSTNALVIEQGNVNWRREVATANTEAVNRTNELNATNVLDISNQGYANLWQEHGDLMEYAWESSEGEAGRQNAIILSHLAAGTARTAAEISADNASSTAMGEFVGKLILGSFGF